MPVASTCFSEGLHFPRALNLYPTRLSGEFSRVLWYDGTARVLLKQGIYMRVLQLYNKKVLHRNPRIRWSRVLPEGFIYSKSIDCLGTWALRISHNTHGLRPLKKRRSTLRTMITPERHELETCAGS